MAERVFEECKSLQETLFSTTKQTQEERQHLHDQMSKFSQVHSEFNISALQDDFEQLNQQVLDRIQIEIDKRDDRLFKCQEVVDKAEKDIYARIEQAIELLNWGLNETEKQPEPEKEEETPEIVVPEPVFETRDSDHDSKTSHNFQYP